MDQPSIALRFHAQTLLNALQTTATKADNVPCALMVTALLEMFVTLKLRRLPRKDTVSSKQNAL